MKLRSGSVILEGAVASALVFMALVANLEVVRRAFAEVIAHHSAFVLARAAVIGARKPLDKTLSRFWRESLGVEGGRNWERNTSWSVVSSLNDQIARVHTEFPSWLRFPLVGGTKNRFEVTRKCRFPYSR